MEKPARTKNRLLKFLPKAASAVTFQNPPFSPGKDKRPDITANKLKTHLGRGFSGPIISMIPAEALLKSKNSSFEAQEPTSPKISCMGQIKHRKKLSKNFRQVSMPKDFRNYSAPPPLHDHHVKNVKPSTIKPVSSFPDQVKNKKPSKIRNIFSSSAAKPAAGRKSDASSDHHHHHHHGKPPLPDRAPSLSQMQRFASGRDGLSNFDWAAQISMVESDHRNYYSEEERGESDGEEEEEAIIPFSAPILIGGGVALEPKKEINLWKRRTMAQPKPLQLNSSV